MKGATPLSLMLRGFFLIAACVLAAIAVVAGIGWWSGWTVLASFQRAIQTAGLVLIGLGFLLIQRNQDTAFQEKDNGGEERQMAETLTYLVQRFGNMLILFIAGGVCMLIGWLL